VHPPLHRVIRAALFAIVCVGVAAVLHGAADGSRPTWLDVAVGVPVIWLAAWPTLGRERSGFELTAGLGAAQIGLHYLFTYLCTFSAAPHSATPLSPAAMAASMPGMTNMDDMSSTTMHPPGATMFVAHVLAVGVCGWWLRQGERDFFALCHVVAALFAAPLRWLADAIVALYALARVSTDSTSTDGDVLRRRRSHRVPDGRLRLRRTPLLTTVTFRGPPVLA
jgi:hypothetical protein